MVKIYVDKVVDDLYILRIDDDRTKYFEALWYIPEGVTYNAYILTAGDQIVLFDTWKHVYSDLFVETIREVVDPRDIDFIVLHHLEQDHSGALPRILEANGYKATVLAHPLAKSMIESFYNIRPKFKAVKDGETLDLTKYSLKFIYTPWLHWPETMVTYIEQLKALVTCDAFGGFSTPSTLYDVDENIVKEYLGFAKKYTITIVGHYKDYILKAVDKLKSQGIDIKIIAPAHGLVWKNNPQLIIEKYAEWAKGVPVGNKVVVVYDTMYGYVEKAVNIIVDELSKNDVNVKVYVYNESSQSLIADILSDIVDSSGIVLGVSTYEADVFPEIMRVVNYIAKKASFNKPAIIVSSYGWGDVAGKKVAEILRKSGYDVIGIVGFKGLVKEDIAKRLRELVKEFMSKIR